MATGQKEISVFLSAHPVFTMQEFREYFVLDKKHRKASDVLLHHRRLGRIGRIKEGLYFAIRPGQSEETSNVDAFLLASKLAPDAVLAFHTSLDVKGLGHSEFNQYSYFSSQLRPRFNYRTNLFRAIRTPAKLRAKSQELLGTEKVERLGVKLTVTTNERTLVESLERPQLCGGFEEMYRSLEKIPYLQLAMVAQYLDVREEKNLYARVGFFLERHREQFHVDGRFLETLASRVPRRPVYWTRRTAGGVLVKPWNLIVPEAVHERRWEAP